MSERTDSDEQRLSGSCRRRHVRTRSGGFHFAIDLDDAGVPMDSTAVLLLDISRSGCGLVRVNPVPVCTMLGLHMWTTNGYRTELVEVRFVEELHSGWTKMGVEFVPAPAGQIDAIRRFIETTNTLPQPRGRAGGGRSAA